MSSGFIKFLYKINDLLLIKFCLIMLLLFNACNSVETNNTANSTVEGYNLALHEISDNELLGHTLAEWEAICYEKQYFKKRDELKTVYNKFVEMYQKIYSSYQEVMANRLQKIDEQEKDFENFITSYAKKNSWLYCRSIWYHYYGAIIDMIDLRIKHLKIHIQQAQHP